MTSKQKKQVLKAAKLVLLAKVSSCIALDKAQGLPEYGMWSEMTRNFWDFWGVGGGGYWWPDFSETSQQERCLALLLFLAAEGELG